MGEFRGKYLLLLPVIIYIEKEHTSTGNKKLSSTYCTVKN